MALNSTSHSPSTHHEDSVPPSTSRKAGGWRAIAYILGNESFEKLASMSLIANLTVYLRTKYNLGGIFLVNVVTIWTGSSNVLSIAGAIVSDAYLGRFLTLLFGSISSLVGMGTTALTAAIPELRPPACHEPSACEKPQGWQILVLLLGLGLLAIGAGGIRPCNIAFGADQFDTRTEKGKARLESFFNWWYFSFTIALMIALTGVVYVQTNISWAIGFAIPTVCLACSIIIFLIGRKTYIIRKPQGSIFIDMAKVISASIKKRKVNLRQSSDHTFYSPATDEELEPTKLMLTDRFNCLNKAAVILDSSELDCQGQPTDSWRLCSVQQVEQLKCLVGIVPVWCSAIGCFVVMDQQNTFGNLQGIQMNQFLGPHFKVPPAWMGNTSMIALSFWIFIYQRLYLPTSRKIMKRDARITLKEKIRTGIVMSILCMVVAGIIEKKRRESALKHGSHVSPLSIGFLLPQFVLSGLTEAFAAVAIMEFFTVQMPESMRSIAGAVFFLSLSIGSYLSSLIVNIIHVATGKNGRQPWLGDHDLNKNRLDYYYFIIASLGVINFVYFTFFAGNYVSSKKAITTGGDLQLDNHSISQSRKFST
ncbi:protein NRT1/ PTR FAMILY 2.8-like [Coffea arabica]|uniref:Protein NRT1/ PTR FAMILY 2.8-like n=1 Tax=Coffea arabica TaxID=13443 RepID=A0A6P6XAU0_COFAR|nr:protein NRT1/ PTR FAMILY 2.8-like [Coffea arabica]